MSIVKLPTEIFKVIVNYLTDKDVNTCQSVCSSWYKIWMPQRYHCIQLKGKTQCHSFFHNTLKNSLYQSTFSVGYQIRKLIIERGHIEPSMLGQLPNLCPFLNVFMFDGLTLSEIARKEPFQHLQEQKKKEELNKVKHNFSLWSQMNQIVELNGISVSLELLQQPTNLTSIYVQFNNKNDRTNLKSCLINSLIHAPNLKSFAIEHVYISYDELETIHFNCPQLQSLYLTDAVFLPIHTFPKDHVVLPARYLNYFHFIHGSFLDSATIWLDYISKKYPNVFTLNINSTLVFSDRSVDSKIVCLDYKSKLSQIAKFCTKLKSFKLSSFILDDLFFRTLDQTGIFLQDLTLGNSLKLGLEKELQALLRSHQPLHLKALTLTTSQLTSTLLTCVLSHCTLLTQLTLATPSTSLDLILKACPTLQSCSISNAALLLSGTPLKSHPLSSLRLENVRVGNETFEFLSRSCRSLVSLCLISVLPVLSESIRFDICLPFHQLRSLVLDRVKVSERCSPRLGTSKFKLTSEMGVVWYDLVGYDYHNTHCFVQEASDLIHVSENVVVQNEKMRVKKIKRLEESEALRDESSPTAYVSIACKTISSLYLGGLRVI